VLSKKNRRCIESQNRQEARGMRQGAGTQARGKRQHESVKSRANVEGLMGGLSIFNLIFSIVFLPLYLLEMWIDSILLFGKKWRGQ
jgi:hypothetical protein